MLIEVDVAGVDREQGINVLREQIVPAIKAQSGFQSGTWLNEDSTPGPNLSAIPRAFSSASAPVVRCEVREVAATA